MWSPNFSRYSSISRRRCAGFLLAHAVEDRGRGGEILPQTFGVIGVDALVFFFQSDRQRQNLALGEAVEGPHC